MSATPAFQFYPDNFLGGVSEMTQAEVGAYILLLCHQWNRGSIPVHPDRQKMLAKGDVTDHVLSKFREDENGLLKNERMEIERQKQAQFREAQRVKGVKSGTSRRTPVQPRFNPGSTGHPTGHPTGGQPEANSLSLSSSSVLLKKEVLGEVVGLLNSLGELYGRGPGQPAGYDEQQHAVNVIQRTGWEQELETLKAWYKSFPSEKRQYRPQSMRAMLEQWQNHLDKAHSSKQAPVKRFGVRGIL